jgi:methionyl aminopeptidase
VIQLKTAREISEMAAAGRLVAAVLAATQLHAKVGVRLSDLDRLARQMLSEAGAGSPFLGYQPHGARLPYPAVICTSVNDAVLHGIPTDYRLSDGDLLSLDFGAEVGGWVGDAAVSLTVGQARAADVLLIRAAEQALAAGIAAATVGGRLGDISAAISAVGRRHGYGLNTDYGGHGVGREMHEPPSVPNDGKAGRGLRLTAGLVIAIEPWFMQGGDDRCRVDRDGWTVRSHDGSRTAHVEHTIAITDDGPRILTTAAATAAATGQAMA